MAIMNGYAVGIPSSIVHVKTGLLYLSRLEELYVRRFAFGSALTVTTRLFRERFFVNLSLPWEILSL